jgi:hypothetical protein
LSEVGLPQSAIPIALLFFNVGVEVGQLFFIAAVLVTVALARQVAHYFNARQLNWVWRIPPYTIGGVAMSWVIQHVASF